jgi:hypothetical protein
VRLYALHFRERVVPRLHNLVRAEAVCIAHGVEGYDNAMNVVMRHARELGANYLPDIFELEDWVAITLRNEIDEAERVIGP